MTPAQPSRPPDGADAIDQLASEYVLGTLSSARRRDVELRMLSDAALRAAVHGWQERLLPLASLAEPVEPSAGLWLRIESQLANLSSAATSAADAAEGSAALDATYPAAGAATRAAGRQPAPAALPTRGWRNLRLWNNLRLWRGLAGGGFAAAAVLAAVLVTRLGAPPPPQYLVVLVAPQNQAPGWVVQASTPHQISLIPLATTPVPAEKALQFWTKGDNWAGPVSLGLVKPGQTLQIPLDKLPPLEPNQLFELTLEPANGSPIGKPTGPIQFIGRAVKVI